MSKYAKTRAAGPFWPKGNINTLLDIKDALKNKKWFLIGGTLLGAVREHKLLSNRSCLNIAVLDKDNSAFALLKKIGFKLSPRTHKYGFFVVATRHDAYVDVHIFQEVSDGVIVQRLDPACSPYHVYYAKLPKKFFSKLSSVTISNYKLPAPNHPEEFLTLTYGDWQTKTIHHCSVKAFEKYIIE